MNVDQLGQQIKTKHPEYSNKSDSEVGQAVLKKYPQYQSMITHDTAGQPVEPGLLGKIGGVASDIFKGVTAPVVTSLARGGMAVQDVAQIGAKTLETGSLQKGLTETKTPEWNLPYYGKVGAPTSAEEIGGTALQTVAAGLGPVAGGAAYMGGQAMTENKGMADVLKQSAIGGVLGKVGDVAFKVGGKLLSATGEKLLQPFASSVKTDVVEAAARQGVDLPLSAKTSSKIVQTLEANAKSGVFGKNLESTVNNAREKVVNLVQGMSKNINLDTSIDNTKDAVDVGNVIKKSFSEAKSVYKDTRTKLYESVMPKIKTSPAVLDNTINALKSIIEEKGASRDPAAASHANYFQSLLDNFETASKDTRNWQTGHKIANTFENLKQTRTDIGAKLKGFADPIVTGNKAGFNRLYAALSEDLDSTVAKYDPAHAEGLKAANEYYKEGLIKFNSAMGKKIANSTKPELLVDQILRPKQVSEVEAFKNVVSPEAFADVQTIFVNNIMDKSSGINGEVSGKKLATIISKYGDEMLKSTLGEDGLAKLTDTRNQAILNDIVNSSVKDGQLSSAKLVNKIDTYGEDFLKQILPEQQFNDLLDASKISKAISEGGAIGANSKTAEKGRVMGYVIGAALSPLKVVKSIIGEGSMTKFLESKGGQKYLTEGYGEMKGVSKLGGFLSGIPNSTREIPKKNIPGTPELNLFNKAKAKVKSFTKK